MAGPPTPNIPVALDLNIITLPCTFHLRIEDKEVVYKLLEAFPATGVAAATCAGLAAFFLLYYRDVWRIVRNVIVGNDHDQDPAVNDINPGSLLVDITCKTEESLLTLGRRYGDGSLATDIENGLKSIGYDKPITVTAEKDGKPFALDKVHQALLQAEGGEDHGKLHEGSDVKDKDTEHLESGDKTMTTVSSLTSQEHENNFRLYLILERATVVLRDVLTRELQKAYPGDFDPSTGILYNVLNIPDIREKLDWCRKRHRLHLYNYQLLYPDGSPSLTAKVADFDITLTVLFLRYMTTLNPNAKWDNPLNTDLSTEADIGRVKTYRNKHAHSTGRLPAATFKNEFEGLKAVLLRLSKIHTAQDYDKILIDPILSLGELVHEGLLPVSFARQLMSLNLPTKDSNFCGREDLLTEVENSQIVLLTGIGGIGKTSIAVEMGHRMSEKGRDVLFLDMRQVENLDLFRLLLVQHYNQEEINNPIADLQNLFQKTLSDIKSATVVIFDNIDHLLSDEKRKEFLQLVEDMLEGSKHLSLVCTSRKTFELPSVKVVEKHIPPLDDSSSTQLLFKITSERDAGVLKEIAAGCGHSPLALKLLASQIENKGSLQVLMEMKKKGVLEAAHISSFEGLVPCFEISLETLSDKDKALFFGLYIFPVSFHIIEVSQIFEINEDKCKEILDSLTSKSVVNRVSDQVYDLHPLLKAFSEYKANFDPDKKLKVETAYCKFYGEKAIVLAKMSALTLSQTVEESKTIPKLLLAARLLLKQLSNYQLERNISSTTTSATAMDTYRSTYTNIIQRVNSIASVFRELQLVREAQDLSEECSQLSKAMSSQTEISVQG